jgi:predicted GNAT superfamily acetyltransferase
MRCAVSEAVRRGWSVSRRIIKTFGKEDEAMAQEIRKIKTHGELRECIALQEEIWGLDAQGTMSPVTLKALTFENPNMSVNLGAFVDGVLAGFMLVIPSFRNDMAYAHMFGVLPKYRNMGLGTRIYARMMHELSDRGIRSMAGTFDPLECKNAHIYLNKMGAVAYGYVPECYDVECEMHKGLPLDRMLLSFPVTVEPPSKNLHDDAPLAMPDSMPEEKHVLVEIPRDLAGLKKADLERAAEYRMQTREVLSEYLNNRGYQAVGVVLPDDGATGRYLLEKGEAA